MVTREEFCKKFKSGCGYGTPISDNIESAVLDLFEWLKEQFPEHFTEDD